MDTKTKEKAPPPLTREDVLQRKTEEKERDEWYAQRYAEAKNASPLAALDSNRIAATRKLHFVEVIKKQGEILATHQVPMIPGIYDKATLGKVLREIGMAETFPEKEVAASAIFKAAAFPRVIALGEEGESIGKEDTISVAPVPEGVVMLSTARPILGTVLTFAEDGTIGYDCMRSAKEYIEYLPGMLGAANVGDNLWCLDLPCREVAHMADHAGELLDLLRLQLKNLHGVTVYTVVPRWLRYYSDGDMNTQRSKGFGIRNAPYGRSGGLRPLLYDGPTWCVGVKMGKKFIPGRLFLNPAGQFICSDWCQREVDKGGGIDLHTGENTKHNLMTWCAGPGISRFGSHDEEITARHGTVRRARGVQKILDMKAGLDQTPKTKDSNANYLLRPSLVPLYAELKRLSMTAPGDGIEHVDPYQEGDGGGINSTRFVVGNGKAGPQWHHSSFIILARTNKNTAITFFQIEGKSGKDKSLGERRLHSGAVPSAQAPISLHWWDNPQWATQFEITDPERRKKVYQALVRFNSLAGAKA